MTRINRSSPSDLPLMTSTGFKTKNDDHKEKVKKYGGYKRDCVRCEELCKQWNNPTVDHKFCIKYDRR